MANPFVKSRIVLKHSGTTLYDLANAALDFDIKTNLNSIDTFNFSLPTLKGALSRPYLDVLLYDDVLLYLGQDTIPANPLLAGKVVKITGQAQDTVQRTFFCKDLSEAAERRFKTKYYGAVAIHDIIVELATDLGWGTGLIGAETHTATENFDGLSYLELINRLSDYWVSGTTCVRKDWKVDTSENLVWNDRPLRSTGVEVLVAGNTLMKPVVHYDIETIKNYIRVFGNRSRTEPETVALSDLWTESLTNWTHNNGALSLSTDTVKGTYSVYNEPPGYLDDWTSMQYAPTVDVYCGERKDGFSSIHFKMKTEADAPKTVLFELYTALPYKMFQIYLHNLKTYVHNQWCEFTLGVGPQSEGTWLEYFNNNNDWNNPIIKLRWYFQVNIPTAQVVYAKIDDLYFNGGRFKSPPSFDGTSSPPTGSIGSYGQRESSTVDDKLLSDTECLNRQKSLLYQFKDPIPLVTCPVPLNLNLLTGDRLTLTIPSENLTAAPFDLVGVRHVITHANAQTIIDGVGTTATRLKPAMNALEAIRQRFHHQDLLSRGVQQR